MTRAFNPSYTAARSELLALVPRACRRILDVGCATGATGAALKSERPDACVVGVEFDPQMAEAARNVLDTVVIGDIGSHEVVRDLTGEPFDCILCGDVLEHLVDPWSTLRRLVTLGTPDVYLVASLPNVAHISTFATLLRGVWPYRPRGIHDRTHLRFFARENVAPLLAQADLSLLRLERKYRLVEHPHPLNRFARGFAAAPVVRDLFTFQFLVLAQKNGRIQDPPRRWTTP